MYTEQKPETRSFWRRNKPRKNERKKDEKRKKGSKRLFKEAKKGNGWLVRVGRKRYSCTWSARTIDLYQPEITNDCTDSY